MRSIRMQSSPAETLEGWNLQFQTEVLFADNFCPICRQFGHLGKLSTNMASVLVYRVQHSLVSAGCKALFIFFVIKVKELSSKGKGTFREKHWSSHFWESATTTKNQSADSMIDRNTNSSDKFIFILKSKNYIFAISKDFLERFARAIR